MMRSGGRPPAGGDRQSAGVMPFWITASWGLGSGRSSQALRCWARRGIVFMIIVMASLSGMRDGYIPITLILVLVLYLAARVANGHPKRQHIPAHPLHIGGRAARFWVSMSRGRRWRRKGTGADKRLACLG